ncbi:unnamed protein product [Chrysoparadoxa australica]
MGDMNCDAVPLQLRLKLEKSGPVAVVTELLAAEPYLYLHGWVASPKKRSSRRISGALSFASDSSQQETEHLVEARQLHEEVLLNREGMIKTPPGTSVLRLSQLLGAASADDLDQVRIAMARQALLNQDLDMASDLVQAVLCHPSRRTGASASASPSKVGASNAALEVLVGILTAQGTEADAGKDSWYSRQLNMCAGGLASCHSSSISSLLGHWRKLELDRFNSRAELGGVTPAASALRSASLETMEQLTAAAEGEEGQSLSARCTSPLLQLCQAALSSGDVNLAVGCGLAMQDPGSALVALERWKEEAETAALAEATSKGQSDFTAPSSSKEEAEIEKEPQSGGGDDVVASEALVEALMKRGFSKNGVIRAARATRNASLDVALAWCFAHCGDKDFDAPLPPPSSRRRDERVQGRERHEGEQGRDPAAVAALAVSGVAALEALAIAGKDIQTAVGNGVEAWELLQAAADASLPTAQAAMGAESIRLAGLSAHLPAPVLTVLEKHQANAASDEETRRLRAVLPGVDSQRLTSDPAYVEEALAQTVAASEDWSVLEAALEVAGADRAWGLVRGRLSSWLGEGWAERRAGSDEATVCAGADAALRGVGGGQLLHILRRDPAAVLQELRVFYGMAGGEEMGRLELLLRMASDVAEAPTTKRLQAHVGLLKRLLRIKLSGLDYKRLMGEDPFADPAVTGGPLEEVQEAARSELRAVITRECLPTLSKLASRIHGLHASDIFLAYAHRVICGTASDLSEETQSLLRGEGASAPVNDVAAASASVHHLLMEVMPKLAPGDKEQLLRAVMLPHSTRVRARAKELQPLELAVPYRQKLVDGSELPLPAGWARALRAMEHAPTPQVACLLEAVHEDTEASAKLALVKIAAAGQGGDGGCTVTAIAGVLGCAASVEEVYREAAEGLLRDLSGSENFGSDEEAALSSLLCFFESLDQSELLWGTVQPVMELFCSGAAIEQGDLRHQTHLLKLLGDAGRLGEGRQGPSMGFMRIADLVMMSCGASITPEDIQGWQARSNLLAKCIPIVAGNASGIAALAEVLEMWSGGGDDDGNGDTRWSVLQWLQERRVTVAMQAMAPTLLLEDVGEVPLSPEAIGCMRVWWPQLLQLMCQAGDWGLLARSCTAGPALAFTEEAFEMELLARMGGTDARSGEGALPPQAPEAPVAPVEVRCKMALASLHPAVQKEAVRPSLIKGLSKNDRELLGLLLTSTALLATIGAPVFLAAAEIACSSSATPHGVGEPPTSTAYCLASLALVCGHYHHLAAGLACQKTHLHPGLRTLGAGLSLLGRSLRSDAAWEEMEQLGPNWLALRLYAKEVFESATYDQPA